MLRSKPLEEVQPDEVKLPDSCFIYQIRPGDPDDCEKYAGLINAAFRRSFHSAQEIATFTTGSPSFRADLELIAADADGKFVALAGMIYDDTNRFGIFEPVCAHPGPKPLGLTGQLMLEGVRRLKLLGADYCYVGTGIGMAANRFYETLGFRIIHRGWYWVKDI